MDAVTRVLLGAGGEGRAPSPNEWLTGGFGTAPMPYPTSSESVTWEISAPDDP
jgi:hypothetical protein